MSELFRLEKLCKAFPGVKALNDVSFSIEKGEVLALMGENGAGKSTLIKILAGAYRMDSGEIFCEGKKVQINDRNDSTKLGISIIFQELNLFSNLSVAENIFVNREFRKAGFIYDREKTNSEAKLLLERVGLNCSPDTKLGKLSVSQRQMVEIAKALSADVRLIIMDEPTSSLTDTEVDKLFDIINNLKKRGVSILFVSHKINEVRRIADRVHILRDGEYIATLKKEEITEEAIIKSMVGRTLENIFVKQYAEIGEIALEVRNLCTKNFLKNISFNVRKGEIVGFAGLVGAGRSEVMRAVFGLDAISEGEILIDGKPVRINSPSDAIKHGLGLVPEDRKHDGLILGMSVMKNGSIVMLGKLSKHGLINDALEYETIESYVEKLSIKTPSMEKEVKDLSGGNQQKVVVAKWLANNPQILIVDEPTRGIDVAAKKEIHNLISNLAKSGVAIIMISSEMPEVLGMCDRIYVMHEGRIRSELCREEATQEKIMKVILQEDA